MTKVELFLSALILLQFIVQQYSIGNLKKQVDRCWNRNFDNREMIVNHTDKVNALLQHFETVLIASPLSSMHQEKEKANSEKAALWEAFEKTLQNLKKLYF